MQTILPRRVSVRPWTVALSAAGTLWVALTSSAPIAVAQESSSTSTINVSTRDELIQAVAAAKPGTKILLAPGTYNGGFSFNNLRGAEGKPIILAAADPAKPPVLEGGTTVLHLSDPAYVELHNLVITKARANGLNIDDGGSYDSPAQHVVLRGVVVRDNGADANHDGLKLSGLDNFRIERCTVERWGRRGSGIDMVGCHQGVISDCTFREGDKINANAVQMKGGSRDITVEHCRFDDAGGRAVNIGGSTGTPYFRPKAPGYEAKDITVADCTFIGSAAPIAFVGVDGAHVHHNTIYRPTRWVARILQENQAAEFARCRNGRFTNNLIAFQSSEVATLVNVGGSTSPETFTFAENFWYCLDRPDRSNRDAQLPTREKGGVYGQDPKFRAADKGDFQIAEGGSAKGYGARPKPTKTSMP